MVSRDKPMKRSAQDDDFVGVLKKNIPNKLALMGHRPTQAEKNALCPAIALHGSFSLPFVTPTEVKRSRAICSSADLFLETQNLFPSQTCHLGRGSVVERSAVLLVVSKSDAAFGNKGVARKKEAGRTIGFLADPDPGRNQDITGYKAVILNLQFGLR
jgi:hypothetical protein